MLGDSCDQMLRNAFTEIATSYGPIGQFWFDHGKPPALATAALASVLILPKMPAASLRAGNSLFVDLVDKYQPGASIAGREWTLVGTEGGFVLNGPNTL